MPTRVIRVTEQYRKRALGDRFQLAGIKPPELKCYRCEREIQLGSTIVTKSTKGRNKRNKSRVYHITCAKRLSII